ncbi:MAG: YqgE/AlgH family protein [Alphaproteobacteria bacterium]|nr:YqgE/AlgH family protein [Alphaproteobacteria bacterium]
MAILKRLLMVVLGIGLLGGGDAKAGGDDTNPNGRSSSLTGRYLVAAPDMHDPNFRQSVIYLVHHDAFGAMGVVINRLMAKGPVGRLLDAFSIEGDPGSDALVKMHYGGPVEPESSLVLHRSDYRASTTTDIGHHLAVSSSDDVLADLALGKGPNESLLILGYAGWASEQLENEITAGSWYVVDADDTLLFDDDIATKWRRALALRGFEL